MDVAKKIIAFRELEFPHTARAIFTSLMTVFRDLHNDDKIYNASSNRATISMFENSLISPRSGNFYNMKCVCHIINMIMQAGLQKIDDCLEKN